jgi:glycosyltransferase involved in cell wall biosynthesis
MKLSGFTFIRNTLKYDYPFQEAVESMLPLIDELVINVGDSDDGTEELVKSLIVAWKEQYTKLEFKLIQSKWNDSLTDSGLVLSEQTNIALDACTGDWGLYLQADEALHEGEHSFIRQCLADAHRDPGIDGLRLRYLHFYGGYTAVQRPWNWYPSEIRLIRLNRGIRSFGDAQTFKQSNDSNVSSRLIDAHIFHYGHARHPDAMKNKIHYFHRFWHGDNHKINVAQAYNINMHHLVWYWGTHPAVYKKRVAEGIAWSPKPTDILSDAALIAVLAKAPETKALGIDLVNILSRRHKMVLLTDSFFEILRWHLKKDVLLIDLESGRRGYLVNLFYAVISRLLFKRRLAYVDQNGKMPSGIAKVFKNVCWTTHENSKEGFVVPREKRAYLISAYLRSEVIAGSLDSK